MFLSNFRWLALVSIVSALWPSHSVKAQTPNPILGVQTHFSQAWPATWLNLAKKAGATSIRDSVPWSQVERSPGVYTFTSPEIKTLESHCNIKNSLLLVATPKNPIYDGGSALRSKDAKQAFARYLIALKNHFGQCLIAFEIGNEINSVTSSQIYHPNDTPAIAHTEYVDLLRTIRTAIHEGSTQVKILGGSSNMVATGFLERLFALGMLDVVDGIAVHPYRSQPENLDIELTHLKHSMQRHGRIVPIWATEFSDNYIHAADAPPQLIKTISLLTAANVEASYWYALVDQKWFKNMGLYLTNGTPKPAFYAFRIAQTELLAHGPAKRIHTSDPNVHLYQFGDNRWVIWGASGQIAFDKQAKLLQADGTSISGNTACISDRPVIALGSNHFTLINGPVLADSLLGYQAAPWSYVARTKSGVETDLHWLDGQWSSSLGNKYQRPLWISDVAGAPAGSGSNAIDVIVRYTAPQPQSVSVTLCIDKKPIGDGVRFTVTHNHKELTSTTITHIYQETLRNITFATGDTLDFIIGPGPHSGGDGFRYRIRISEEPHTLPMKCLTRSAEI